MWSPWVITAPAPAAQGKGAPSKPALGWRAAGLQRRLGLVTLWPPPFGGADTPERLSSHRRKPWIQYTKWLISTLAPASQPRPPPLGACVRGLCPRPDRVVPRLRMECWAHREAAPGSCGAREGVDGIVPAPLASGRHPQGSPAMTEDRGPSEEPWVWRRPARPPRSPVWAAGTGPVSFQDPARGAEAHHGGHAGLCCRGQRRTQLGHAWPASTSTSAVQSQHLWACVYPLGGRSKGTEAAQGGTVLGWGQESPHVLWQGTSRLYLWPCCGVSLGVTVDTALAWGPQSQLPMAGGSARSCLSPEASLCWGPHGAADPPPAVPPTPCMAPPPSWSGSHRQAGPSKAGT